MSTKIEWVVNSDGTQGKTWNPITGCSHKSTGCKFCYAEVMTKRLQKMTDASAEKYKDTLTNGKFNGTINFDEKALLEPLKRKKPTTYFMSMSDLFHENVKWKWIDKIFAIMALTPHHTYQILTKRTDRMLEYCSKLNIQQEVFELVYNNKVFHSPKDFDIKNYENIDFLPNVWLGTSVENQTQANKRIPYLLQVPAAVRFVSAEPLLGNIDFKNIVYDHNEGDIKICSLTGDWFHFQKGSFGLNYGSAEKIDWVIVGGESGHNARPMHPDWVRRIMKDCKDANVPFFFKQWGKWVTPSQMPPNLHREIQENGKGIGIGDAPLGFDKKRTGNFLDGKQYLEMPNHYDKQES